MPSARRSAPARADSVPRRRLDPSQRKEELLDAAAALFEHLPFDKITIEQIATECGVSTGLLYRYFPNKRALYIAVLKRSVAEFLDQVGGPASNLPADRPLVQAIDDYLDFITKRPRSYLAWTRGGIGMDPEVHALVQGAREELCQRLLNALDVPEPAPDFMLLIWGWLGLAEAICTRWLEEPKLDTPQVRDLLIRSAAKTFLAEAPLTSSTSGATGE